MKKEPLKESEERYRNLIQNIRAGVVVHDSSTKIIVSNSVAQTLLGLTEDQLMGKTAIDPDWHFLREDGTRMPIEEYPVNIIMASKQALRDYVLGIHHTVRKDITWVLVNGDPVLDLQGNISETIITFIDITDRIRNNAINTARLHLMQFAANHTLDELLEETLNESEKLTNSLIGFYHFVEDDQISLTLQNWSTRTKDKFCKAEGKGLHYPIDQAGVWVDCVYQRKPVIHNDYASLPNRRGMPEGHAKVIRELVVPVIRADNVKAILGVGNKPSDYGEKDIEAISLLADLAWEIAERKFLEKELHQASVYNRSLIEASLDPLVTISAEGKITDVNEATEQATGRRRLELIGADFSDYFTEPDKAREGYQQVFASGFVKDYPLAIRHQDGHITDVLYNASVYRDAAGKVLGVFAAARDVTERKQSEDELQEHEKHSQSLLRLSRSLEQAQSYAEVLNAARNEVRNILGYQNLWAYLLTEDKKYLKALVAEGPSSDFIMSEEGTAILTIAGDKMLEEIDTAKEIVLVEDAQTDSRVNKEIVKQMGIRTLINVPIILFDRHFGSFGTGTFGDEGVRIPSNSGQKYLIAMASHVAVAFDRIHLIIQRKKAEEVLRTSEEALKEAQRIAHLGTWHMDLATNQVVWSEVLYKMYGLDPMLPPPLYTESMKLFTAESWERLSTHITQTTQTGIPYELELETVNKNGSKGWMWARGELVRDASGAPVRVRGVVMDITERKRAENALREKEERLALATFKNGVGVWDWNLQTQEMIWDDSMYALYHIHREDFSGTEEAWRASLHPDDLTRGDLEVADAIAGKKPFETEFRVVWPGGEVRYIKAVAKVFRDEQGTPLRMLGINMDVTDRNKAENMVHDLNRDLEQRITERTAQLEAANKELEAFSYSVSHDLRSPLRAINGFSHLLQENYAEKLDDEGKRLLNVVMDNANRMGQLIDDILKFSRTGRFEMNFSEIDMATLARDVYQELKPATGHELQVKIGQLPSANGDLAMMRQVFVNLLSNAIKFTRNKVSIQIEVESYAGENEMVYFVKDNGAGFDMQYVNKLFGVFQRLHNENEFEGTGIGLAIVKRIITRHGGRVWAESKVNEGTTIYFSLPK